MVGRVAMGRKRRGRSRTGGALVLLLAPALALAAALGPARAGAWLLPKGEGLSITTGFASRAEARFDGHRGLGDGPAFRKAEIQTLVEYGVADGFTLRGRTEWRRFSAGNEREAGFGFTELGGRARLFQRGPLVLSAEASLRAAQTRETVARPVFMPGFETEGEARLLAGYGFTLAGRPAFLDAEGAYRFRDGGRPDEIRADLTLGVRPWPRTLLLAQGFETVGLGEPGPAGRPYDYAKVQASLVQDLTPRIAVQAGAFATVAGRNALAERGLLLALWVRF